MVFQAVLTMAAQLEAKIAVDWQLQALDTVTWIATSVPFINFCHSIWNMVGAFRQIVNPSATFNASQYNPSPWGPIGAIVEHGLVGM
jgi:hypothetical protein